MKVVLVFESFWHLSKDIWFFEVYIPWGNIYLLVNLAIVRGFLSCVSPSCVTYVIYQTPFANFLFSFSAQASWNDALYLTDNRQGCIFVKDYEFSEKSQSHFISFPKQEYNTKFVKREYTQRKYCWIYFVYFFLKCTLYRVTDISSMCWKYVMSRFQI